MFSFHFIENIHEIFLERPYFWSYLNINYSRIIALDRARQIFIRAIFPVSRFHLYVQSDRIRPRSWRVTIMIKIYYLIYFWKISLWKLSFTLLKTILLSCFIISSTTHQIERRIERDQDYDLDQNLDRQSQVQNQFLLVKILDFIIARGNILTRITLK